MKKIAFLPVLLISLLLAVSCQSGPAISSGPVTDETFRAVYDWYINRLILDGATSYTVKSGDSLANIARSLYGDGFYYPVIMLASKDIVLDPDKIQVGMVLTVPDLQMNLANTRARAAIKGVILDCATIEDNRGRTATANGLREHAGTL